MSESLILHDGSHGKVTPKPGETVIHLHRTTLPPAAKEWYAVTLLLKEGASLEGLLPWAKLCGRTSRLSITLKARVSGAVLHAPTGLVDGRSILKLTRDESEIQTSLKLRLAWHAPVWAILASCLTPPNGMNSLGRNALRVGTPMTESRAWSGLAPHATFSDDFVDAQIDPDNPGPTPRMDLSYQTVGPALSAHSLIRVPSRRKGRLQYRQEILENALPPVETRIFNPIGLRKDPSKGKAYLSPAGESSFVILDEQGHEINPPARHLGDRAIRALRNYEALVDNGAAHFDIISRGEFLTRALASGVRVVSSDTDALRPIVGDDVVGLIHDLPETFDASTSALERSIMRQVRTMHRWNTERMSKAPNFPSSRAHPESVSVILATKRPDFVDHALTQFEQQSWENRELLFGFHGFSIQDLGDHVSARVHRLGRHLEFNADHLFGDVLRQLTLTADGDIIAKMDDDDWYSAYHLEDLVYALRYSGAHLVGSGVQFVYMHNSNRTVRRASEIGYKYGGHPGGPTFMSPRDIVLEAGNWPLTSRAVDTGLNQAILEIGGSVFQGHPLNFVFNKRSSGHTWKASNEYFMSRVRESWDGLRVPGGFDAPVQVPDGWLSEPARLHSATSSIFVAQRRLAHFAARPIVLERGTSVTTYGRDQ